MAVGKQIGNFIGTFVEYDTSTNTGLWNAFMRIRVQLEVRQPLKQWKRIRGNNGKSPLIHFKYERLSTFCYMCGMLGHWKRFCEKYSPNEGEGTQGWSPDLRAQMRKPPDTEESVCYGTQRKAIQNRHCLRIKLREDMASHERIRKHYLLTKITVLSSQQVVGSNNTIFYLPCREVTQIWNLLLHTRMT